MFVVLAWIALAATAGLSSISSMQIDAIGWFWALCPSVISAITTYFCARKFGMHRIADAAECLIASLAIATMNLFASYIAIDLNFPLADDVLHKMDAAFGFDWLSLIRLIDQSPTAVWLLRLAYTSFSPQIFGIPLLLCIAGQAARARQMILCFGAVGATASMISVFFPAVGTFGTYLPHHLQNINPHYANNFLSQFNSVRDDPNFIFKPYQADGLLTFPSVHAAVAVLAIWGAWKLSWARLPALMLNAVMIVSTFSNANHYLVDLIAGSALAILAVVVTSYSAALKPIFEGQQIWARINSRKWRPTSTNPY